MPNRLLLATQIIRNLAITALCACLAVAVLRLPDTKQAAEHLRSASDALDRSAWAVHGALVGPQGALQEAHDTLRAVTTASRETARTTGIVRQAAVLERDELKKDSPAIEAILAKTATGVDALGKTATELGAMTVKVTAETVPALTASLQSLDREIAAADPAITALGRAANSAADLVASPDVTAAVHNVADLSGETARLTRGLNVSLYGPEGDSSRTGTFFQLNSTLAGVSTGVQYIDLKLKPSKGNIFTPLAQDGALLYRILMWAGVL